MSWFLSSTVGRAATFYVDLLVGLLAKAFYYLDGDDE